MYGETGKWAIHMKMRIVYGFPSSARERFYFFQVGIPRASRTRGENEGGVPRVFRPKGRGRGVLIVDQSVGLNQEI